MKKAYIIHGWDGSPKEAMLAWIAGELEKKGYEVVVPEMPNPKVPVIEAWVGHVASVVGMPDAETLFVGHSVGCQTVLRYLETLPADVQVGKVILIAPWLTLQNLDPEDESPSIAKPWLVTPINFEKILTHTKDFTCFLSANDPFVPLLENQAFCEEKLGARTIVFEERGHFTEADGIVDLPEILNVLQ